jgi:hypothetical protein
LLFLLPETSHLFSFYLCLAFMLLEKNELILYIDLCVFLLSLNKYDWKFHVVTYSFFFLRVTKITVCVYKYMYIYCIYFF